MGGCAGVGGEGEEDAASTSSQAARGGGLWGPVTAQHFITSILLTPQSGTFVFDAQLGYSRLFFFFSGKGATQHPTPASYF